MPTITLTAGDDTTILTGVSNDGLVDTIYGLAGNDTILGDEGQRLPNGQINLITVEDDLIYGGGGGDSLSGSFGANTIFGGDGEDFIDGRTVTAEIDLDTVYGGANNDSIFGKQGDDIIYGGDGDDNISSNQALLASPRPTTGDTVYGGQGDDTITTLNPAGTNSSSVGDLVYGGIGNDSILGAIENSTPGLDQDNIFGGMGNDVIDGNGGNDSIDAGEGNDTVFAADDADTTDGGDGIDLIDFTNDSGAVVFDMASGATTVTGATGTDVESNVNYENVIGSGDADNIQGNDENNSINGAGGADQLSGGGGSDTFVSGAGDDNITGGETPGTAGVPDIDVVDYSGEGLGIVVNYTGDEAGTAQGVTTGLDTFAEIERIIFTDQDDGVNASADTAGVTLDTGAGDDFVEAGQGNDSLDGGSDSIDPVSGDVIDGGNDTLSYADATDAVTIDLENGTVTETDGDVDNFVNFEIIQASDNNDSIIGSSGNDTVNALEGNDTILAGDGDVVDGGGTSPAPDPNDFDTLQVDLGPTGVSWVVNADPNNPEQGTIEIFDGPNGTGNVVGTIAFSEIENIVCFTRGTMIETPNGEVAIEDLAEGDMVMTRDHGAQPVRWIGSKALPAHGKLAPVMIKAGALDNDRDLKVSQLHRMLVTDWRAELMFGEAEVLAAAKHLVNGDTIYVAEGGDVEYFHMLFDNHEIVTANGAASESFHPGEQGMSWLEEEMREEIFAIFPELRVQLDGYGPAARMSLKAFEARALKR